MRSVRQSLKRHGDPGWRPAEDVPGPHSMLESFTATARSEYQRLSERTAAADEQEERELLEAVRAELPELVAYTVLGIR